MTSDVHQADGLAPTRSPAAPPALLRWLICLLALLGLALAGYLWWQAMQGGGLPGCGPGSPCDAVLSSRYSQWFSVPVSLPAIVLYLLILTAALQIGPGTEPARRRSALRLLATLSLLAGGAALWFIWVQLQIVHQVCPYCMAEHGCSLLLAGLSLWALRFDAQQAAAPRRRGTILGPALVLIAGWAVLAVGQYLAPEKEAVIQRFSNAPDFDTGPGPDRQISILSSRVRLSPHDFPVLGSADARFIFLALVDYTCPHCRIMHQFLDGARARYGSQLAVIVLPVPLEAGCNRNVEHTPPAHVGACELARLSLAMWKTQPDLFAAFDAWLFGSEEPRTPAEARAHAVEVLGEKGLADALAQPWVEEQLQRNIKLYELAGGGVLPKVIVQGLIINAQPGDPRLLYDLLEKDLKIRPLVPDLLARPRGEQPAPAAATAPATQPTP